jgi:hypothetical protein
MKKFNLYMSLFLLGCSTVLYAAAPISKIEAMLAKPNVLCGSFDQSKTLIGIKKALRSNGRFCMVSGKGVLWRTLHPFPNTLRLTRDEIVHSNGERVAMHFNAKAEPIIRMINGVLFALLAGDLTQLENLFEVDGVIDGQTWRVALKARRPELAKAIGNIKLEGGAYVRTINISEASGDTTVIVFSAIQEGESGLTAEEATLL